MVGLASKLDNLFAAAQDDLIQLGNIADRYGLEVAPDLQIVRGHEYRYTDEQHTIHALIPDLTEPLGKLFLLYLQDLLSCPDVDELIDLLTLLQYHGVAHEFAHHLRHYYGRFEPDDMWQEEQWANYFAAAVVKDRLTPAQHRRGLRLLHRALTGLSDTHYPLSHLADTYMDPLRAMLVQGDIDEMTMSRLESASRLLDIDILQLVVTDAHFPDHLRKRLANRARLIASFNDRADKTLVEYMFYTLGWIYLSLASPEQQAVDRFVQEALGVGLK